MLVKISNSAYKFSFHVWNDKSSAIEACYLCACYGLLMLLHELLFTKKFKIIVRICIAITIPQVLVMKTEGWHLACESQQTFHLSYHEFPNSEFNVKFFGYFVAWRVRIHVVDSNDTGNEL